MSEIMVCENCNGTDLTEIAEGQYECQNCFKSTKIAEVKE